ncbi:MAG: hypothetical protein DRR19_05990 [Candidatus Parabeggiatoa sp. nov. 1]|nr:MAG: hypothetical protein DRR19_05990 [Gammaproteobacteria bacterium]
MLNPVKKVASGMFYVTDIFRKTDKRVKAEVSLLLILCMLALVTASWEEIAHNQFTGKMEQQTTAYLDDTLHKAGAAFLIARALNATISVMQSFTMTPFISELSPGEILDPINDLVERFSLVMLAVTVSIGIQKLLMEIGVSVDMTWVILSALFFVLVSLFVQTRISKHRLRLLAYKLLLFVLLVRFAIPVTGLIGSSISATFLAEERDAATQAIEESKKKISELTAKQVASSPNDSLDKLKQDSEEIVSQIIKLITLFLFETILFPLLVLWGLIKLSGAIFYSPVSLKSAQPSKA